MSKKFDYLKTFTFDGRRYYVRGDSEAEVIKKMVNRQRDLAEGKVSIGGNMLLNDWAEICVSTYKTRQSEKTREKYIYNLNHYVLIDIGKNPIKSIKSIQCQEVLNKLSHLSQWVIDFAYNNMLFLFDKAVDNKLIIENPAAHIIKPRGSKSKRRVLTAKEEEAFLDAIKADDRFLLFAIMYHCGCRPGEAIKAIGKDIQTMEGAHLLHVRGTKSDNADRYVPIPNDLYSKIKNTPKFQNIVTNTAGNEFDRSSYKRAWRALKREMNILLGCRVYRNELLPPFPLAGDLVPYCFRHTYCTNLQKKGIDIRNAQYLMGHADIKMTANIYTHNDISSAIEVAKVINK